MSRTQRYKNGLRNSGSHAFPDIPHRPVRARHGNGDECFEAMLRHHKRQQQGVDARSIPTDPALPATSASTGGSGSDAGDIIYGAEAIAAYMYDDYNVSTAKECRRRVYHHWNYYRDRKERAGFFKLKGTLCLSKSQWRKFHGLD